MYIVCVILLNYVNRYRMNQINVELIKAKESVDCEGQCHSRKAR